MFSSHQSGVIGLGLPSNSYTKKEPDVSFLTETRKTGQIS